VEDLHLISMADSDRLFVNRKQLAPVSVLERIMDNYRKRFDQRQITVDMKTKAGKDAHIMGDADRLDQVFTNILENAWKYMRAPGVLRITVKADEHALTLCFEDSGPGVPEAALPRLFDRLYRVENARSRESGGSGLGLCICRHIIDSHGGSIWAESNAMAGLNINIRLPLLRQEDAIRG